MDLSNIHIIAKTIEGLEGVLEQELRQLGAGHTEVLTRAVAFDGNLELLYRVNYCSRVALRVLAQIEVFQARDAEELYRRARDIRWEDVMQVNQTFAVDGVVSQSKITHSGFLALKVKDAIVDRFRQRTGRRPSVDPDRPDILVNVHLFRERCTVSLDSSGSSLHLRGYRRGMLEAPISEVLAAGMIYLSGWDRKSPLLDPMCGSGTILTEAMMMAGNMPAGHFRRRYGFQNWPGFDPGLWRNVKDGCDAGIRDPGKLFFGSDRDEKAIDITGRNIASIGMENSITLEIKRFEELDAPFPSGTIITNPPFGERLKVEDLVGFYRMIGDVLKQKYRGYAAWILGSDPESLKFIGLRPSRRIRLLNGPLECRFVKFELYEGSRKARKNSG